MAIFKQVSMKPAKYRVGNALREFTADDLRAYADGTNAAIAAGIKIPLLSRHAPAGADDAAYQQFNEIAAQFSSDGANALDNYGWLKSVEVNSDGSITPVMEVLNEDAAKAIDDGIIQFTSPEFRDNYVDGLNRNHGRVMRHIAFTPTPRNPDQGKIEKVEAFQFSLDDSVDQPADDDRVEVFRDGKWQFAEDRSADTPPDQLSTDDPTEPNPDMPPKPPNPKAAAIVAQLAEIGVEVPADFELDGSDESCNVLLAALKTFTAAQRKSEEEQSPEAPEVEEESMQFSEDQIAKMSPEMASMAKVINKQADKIDAQDAKIAQFSEDTATSKRQQRKAAAEELLKSAKLLKPSRDRIAKKVASMQFSEDADLEHVKELIEIAGEVPSILQFSESDLSEGDPPTDDGKPQTMEDARKLNEELASEGLRSARKTAAAT